jgi:anti-sigma-K factor RskA
MNAETNNAKMLSPCDELHELLPAYALGVANPEEKQRVQELLAECPEGQADLRAYVQLSQGLLKTNVALQPPAHLHDNLMQAIATPNTAIVETPKQATPAEKIATPIIPLTPKPSARPPLLWGAVAAVLVLFVVTNLFWLTRQSQPTDSVQDTLIGFLNNPQLRPIRLTDGDNAVQAIAFLDMVSGELWVYSEQLASLPNEQTYQVWLIGSDIQSVGLFQTQERRVVRFMLTREITNTDLLGITIEPHEGSDQPTSDPIAIGNIS